MKTHKEKPENPVRELIHILWFAIYHTGYGICYLIKYPIHAIQCKIGYQESPFYKLTGIPQKNFGSGSAWEIGNDQRYLFCNAIEKMRLPLEAVAAQNPSAQAESLLFYYIYKDTIIITHGFYRAVLWDSCNEYHIVRDHSANPDEYDKAYSVSRLRDMNWDKHIRLEHKHMPIKVLHSNLRHRFQGLGTDTFDSHDHGIFYRSKKDLKKIFR